MIKSIVHSTKEDSLVSLKISDPYYRGKPLYICTAKEWFDDVNGNSYWSARVEDIEKDITYIFPFQYGYGDQSLQNVMRALNLSHYDYKKVKYIKITKCSEDETEEHGTGDKDNWISEKGYYYQD